MNYFFCESEGQKLVETDFDADASWIHGEEVGDETSQIDEYDLTSSPNDFNISTIVDFINSGAVKIPGFQRNYVWDIKRASKLIESLIIGLPVPQVFLYEESRNNFLVVDGQQRLMTIYYFRNGRFPRREKRAELRRVFDENAGIPESVLADENYFENFNLRLPEVAPGTPNKFARKNYQTLGDYKTQFDLRTIRNMIVKQVSPTNDDSSIYEMFNRLNTGGVLLTPQEIRSSLYHSPFYDELFRLNLSEKWRALLGPAQPDLHMRDIEVLLRGIAIWKRGEVYTPSMVKFLNAFSMHAKDFDRAEIAKITEAVDRFLNAIAGVPRESFLRQGKFSVPVFEAVFAAVSDRLETDLAWTPRSESVSEVTESEDFIAFSSDQTTDTSNVKGRLRVAAEVMAI